MFLFPHSFFTLVSLLAALLHRRALSTTILFYESCVCRFLFCLLFVAFMTMIDMVLNWWCYVHVSFSVWSKAIKKSPSIGNFEEWNESRRLRARAFAHSFATFNRFVCNAACYIVLYALDELLLYRTALCLNPRNQLIHTHCELRNNYIWKLLTWRVHTFKCLRVSFCFVSGFFFSLSFYFSLFLVHFFEAQFSHSSLYFFVFFCVAVEVIAVVAVSLSFFIGFYFID